MKREQRPIKREARDPYLSMKRERRVPRAKRLPYSPTDPPAQGPSARDFRFNTQGKLRNKTVARAKSRLRYRYAEGHYCEQIRWYFLGAVCVAVVQVHKHGANFHGNYTVFINSRGGNAGMWFKEEEHVHDFIVEELEREPTP